MGLSGFTGPPKAFGALGERLLWLCLLPTLMEVPVPAPLTSSAPPPSVPLGVGRKAEGNYNTASLG